MLAMGIDLGGTKIETQVFDENWACIERRRRETPKSYDALLNAVVDEIQWIENKAPNLPIGIGAAGVIKSDGTALTANLAATGNRLPDDIMARAGRTVQYLNDCRTFTISEAVFGAGREYSTVAGMIFGTGMGGGIAVDKKLVTNPSGLGGEFGHIPAAAYIVQKYDLPILKCGCGRLGCYETLVSGPGLEKISERILGEKITPVEIAQRRKSDPLIDRVWMAWCELAAELVLAISFVIDPDVVVLGGGMSKIDSVTNELLETVMQKQLDGFTVPKIVLAQGGDTSGARGAAYCAWQQYTTQSNNERCSQ